MPGYLQKKNPKKTKIVTNTARATWSRTTKRKLHTERSQARENWTGNSVTEKVTGNAQPGARADVLICKFTGSFHMGKPTIPCALCCWRWALPLEACSVCVCCMLKSCRIKAIRLPHLDTELNIIDCE